jgi:predicted TIM-barrel fold metal-dependent hydrolase
VAGVIIDSHVHLSGEGWIHPSFILGATRINAAAMGRKTGEYPDAVEMARKTEPLFADSSGEKLIETMDAAGVDISCVFTVDGGLATGEPKVPIEEQNRLVAEAAKRYPGRLIPFFAIDPRRPGAVEMFARAVEEWGMRGLKFHPTSGYFPYDQVCYPLYEKCLEYGVPVIIHAGGINAPLKTRYALPVYIDDVAADFPELAIIMAHAGQAMWWEALHVAIMKPNIYFDISAWQITFMVKKADFYRMLRMAIDRLGPWRVFFGSDGPWMNFFCPLDRWVRAVKEPDLSDSPKISFSEEEREIVLGKAFARLMGIEG